MRVQDEQDRRGIRSRQGMALIIVLVFSLALLVLGTSYMNTISKTTVVNPIQLRRLQADFLAQGIAEIALLKFKKFPADFYHSYVAHITGAPAETEPYVVFCEQGTGPDANTPLRNLQYDGQSLGAPVNLLDYTTDYRMLSYKGYDNDGLQITVAVVLDGGTSDAANRLTYVSSFTFDITRRLLAP